MAFNVKVAIETVLDESKSSRTRLSRKDSNVDPDDVDPAYPIPSDDDEYSDGKLYISQVALTSLVFHQAVLLQFLACMISWSVCVSVGPSLHPFLFFYIYIFFQ